MSASSKRRRATSPSSSVSGAGDLDDTASTPGSGRKRRRVTNVTPVDMVNVLYVLYCTIVYEYRKCISWSLLFTFALSDRCVPRVVQRCQGAQGWPRQTAEWCFSKGTKEKVLEPPVTRLHPVFTLPTAAALCDNGCIFSLFSGISLIITKLCLSRLIWQRFSISSSRRIIMTWSSSPRIFSSCSKMQNPSTRYKNSCTCCWKSNRF